MKTTTLPRILIGATGSGCGKTTIVCGILQALKAKGLAPAAFKCGPDYIDPMFHREAMGLSSGNLDLFFTDPHTTRSLLAKNGEGSDFAIIEGVMGYYDGLAGKSNMASSYDLAMKTETPAVLLVDCRGKALSILAEIKGFAELEQDSSIKGVILNRISPMIYEEIKLLIESRLRLKVFGYMPVMKDCGLESRHLGLVTAGEIGNLPEILELLGAQCQKTIDLDGLMSLGQEAGSLGVMEKSEAVEACGEADSRNPHKIRVGVAMDKAFCFYYRDNLQLLEELGCEIVPFSPLGEDCLPKNLQGLYMGGGYPELYLAELAKNQGMRDSVKCAVKAGMPTIAECGGFMYLHEFIKDKDGLSYPMCGAVQGESFYAGKLVRFGYVELLAGSDSLLCQKGDRIRGHEFHYWDSSNNGNSFYAEKPFRRSGWNCVIGDKNLYAGYPHIHFYSNRTAAERFAAACLGFRGNDAPFVQGCGNGGRE